MANPIPLHLPPLDPEHLHRSLEKGVREREDALLAACDILQGLHDRGVLELAKGALGSSEKVLQILVDTANSPEMIRGIRNLMILAKMLSSIDPELLEGVQLAVQEGLDEAQKAKPPGLGQLAKKLMSSDSRRVLAASASILESIGKSLAAKKSE